MELLLILLTTAVVVTFMGLILLFDILYKHLKRWSSLKIKSMKLNNELIASKDLNERYDISIKKIEFSTKYLEFLKSLIGQTIVLEFKTFRDNHVLDKVTQQHLKNFIYDTATKVKLSLNNDENIGYLMYSSTYCDKYIVDVIITMTKDLLEHEVDQPFEVLFNDLNV